MAIRTAKPTDMAERATRMIIGGELLWTSPRWGFGDAAALPDFAELLCRFGSSGRGGACVGRRSRGRLAVSRRAGGASLHMRKSGRTKALYAGSFDPVTRGHLDV